MSQTDPPGPRQSAFLCAATAIALARPDLHDMPDRLIRLSGALDRLGLLPEPQIAALGDAPAAARALIDARVSGNRHAWGRALTALALALAPYFDARARRMADGAEKGSAG